MSKLTDLLDKTQTSSPAIGFAASRQAATTPDIAVIGRMSATELADNSSLADAPADALLVTLDASDGSAASRVGDALKDKLWGVRVGSANAADATALKNAGCDFIVFDPEGTAAAVLNDDTLGKIIAVGFDEPEFDQDEARAIRTLDIDCALLTPTDGLLPLTVQKLLTIQKMRGIVRKRAIINVPADTGKSDLETLRNIGVAAIAVNLAEVGESIQRIKNDIANLPRRKSQSTRGANTPRVGFGGGSASTEDYDEDDE